MIAWLRALLKVEIPEVRCRACDILERQLEVERARVDMLLNRVTNTVISSTPPELEEEEELKPIQTTRRKFIPYAIRQQMAEQNDIATLEKLMEKWAEIHNPTVSTEKIPTEDIEKEILSHASAKS